MLTSIKLPHCSLTTQTLGVVAMLVSGCKRELNAHLYSAVSLWSHNPDTRRCSYVSVWLQEGA